MHKNRTKKVIFINIFCLFFIFLAAPVFANNPPDTGHSNLSASGQAPADGQSTISITITLQDSSGNPLSGDNVSFSAANDSTAVFNPTSTTLNSSGQATFTVTSTTAQTDNINVTDNSSNTPLNNLGQITFTPAASPTPSPTPAGCTDAAPGSTPQITAAVANSSTQITLTWTDATNPVSYYLLAYGLTSQQYIYGNPNIGGQGATSYTVNSLAKGTKYYFAIKAVNGCNTGSFSNEVSAKTTGGVIAVRHTPEPTPLPSPTDAPTDTPAPSPTVQPTIAPTPTPTFILGLTKTKTLEYGGGAAFVIVILGGLVFWKFR